MTHRRDALRLVFGLPFSVACTQKLGAQERTSPQNWPTRTITLVVPFPPGGTADFAARPLADYLSEKFSKNVVVENKGGAGEASAMPMSPAPSLMAIPS